MKNTELDEIRKQEISKLKRLKLPESFSKTIKNAAFQFSGQVPELESAYGAYLVGQLYGWRVLRIVHGSATYNKYEKILGIKFTDVCPDRGVLSHRNKGLRFADSIQSFWKVATGKTKIGKQALQVDEGLDLPKIPD